ncbi:unnamed protein product, partial [Polarella glacialis]
MAAGQLIVCQAEPLFDAVEVGALWLFPKIWVPMMLIVMLGILKLNSARLYYDPYARPRILTRLQADVESDSEWSAASVKPASQKEDESGLRSRAGSYNVVRVDRSRAGSDEVKHEAVSVPSLAALAGFVGPATCLVIANSSMSSVDKAFLGWQSTLQLASMGPAAAAFDSSSFLLTFLNTATLSLLGMAAGDPERCRQIRSHAILLATTSGLFLGCGLFTFATQLTSSLGATANMLPFSVLYLRIRALGAFIERGTSVSTSFCLSAK